MVDFTMIRFIKTTDTVNNRGLARTIGSYKSQYLVLAYIKRDLRKYGYVPKTQAQIIDAVPDILFIFYVITFCHDSASRCYFLIVY